MINVLYFASIKDRLGKGSEQIDYQGDISGLLALLRARGNVWAEVFAVDRPVLVALNQEMAVLADQLSTGDELGLFPPVTGG